MNDAFCNIISEICAFTKLIVPCDSDCFQSIVMRPLVVWVEYFVYRDDAWKPVSFYSQQLQQQEKSYSVTEIEALVMICSIQHFAYYLVARTFKIFTDHKALIDLFNSQHQLIVAMEDDTFRLRLQHPVC